MEHSVLLASQCGSWCLILWLQVNEGHEELDVPDTMEDRTKLLTDMQKDNQQLRLQLARLHQKFVLAQQGSLSMQDSPGTPLTPNLMASTPLQQQFLRPSTDARVQVC